MLFNIKLCKKSIAISYSISYYIVVIPTFVLMMALFICLAVFVDAVFYKCFFASISRLFGVCLILFVIFSIRFYLIVDENGVNYRRRLKTFYLKWDQISEISISCSEERNTVASYHRFCPVTSICFSSRHLTEYEKMYFYDKKMTNNLKIIVWTEITTDETEKLMEQLVTYIHIFSDIEITYFNSHFLKYGVK